MSSSPAARDLRPCLFESLEDRRLLSSTISPPITGPIPVIPPVTAAKIGFHGKVIHAETSEAFTAVLGKISDAPALPKGYTLQGSINWGDGSKTSAATFVKQSDGEIAVLGSHTYTKAKTENITITISKNPPAKSDVAIQTIGKIKSSADVEKTTNGITLTETAGKSFAAGLGSIATTLSTATMKVSIDWGDGKTSIGKLLPEPVAQPGAITPDKIPVILEGRYQVQGTHTYAHTGSYLVHVGVTYFPPSTPGKPTPQFVVMVASFDSVIDVLPPMPMAVR